MEEGTGHRLLQLLDKVTQMDLLNSEAFLDPPLPSYNVVFCQVGSSCLSSITMLHLVLLLAASAMADPRPCQFLKDQPLDLPHKSH